MSESTLSQQIDLLRRELDLRQRVYPTKIKMGQMTKDLADRSTETLRAAIATLEALRKRGSQPLDQTSRYLEIEPTLHHIYRCASEHRAACEHCLSIAQLMEDSLGFVRDKKA